MAVSQVEKIWRVCTALGNIALACSYAPISIDIQVRRKVLTGQGGRAEHLLALKLKFILLL